MRTTIDIDNKLMRNAMKAAGVTTKRETVEIALRELVEREKRSSMLDLAGRVDILPIEEIRPSDT